MIFAVDRQWNIGYDGDMLFKISDDLQRFRRITMGNVLLMGRKTFVSLPGSRPLDGREHVVLTKDRDFSPDGVHIVHSIEEMDAKLKELTADGRGIFLIGGGNLTAQLIDRVQKAHITKVDRIFLPADTMIPNLDTMEAFDITGASDKKVDANGLEYQYVDYERKRA
mgnify:CR=1 FL=1